MARSLKILIVLALIITATIAGMFLWPWSALRVAWGSKGVPETVQIMRYGVGPDMAAIFVTLPKEAAEPFLEQLRETTVQFTSPVVRNTWRTTMYGIWMGSEQAASDVIVDEEGHFVPQQAGDVWPKKGSYRFSDAMACAALLQTCRSYTDPEGGFPGLAFLLEFFALNKDGRADFVNEDAPDGVYGNASDSASSFFALYEGIEPYLTERGMSAVIANRYLYRLEYKCRQAGGTWRCGSVSIDPGSEDGYYNFRVLLDNYGSSGNMSVYGSYAVNEAGLVDSFWLKLP
ncbi:MAG: hypothetical protein K5981_08115 [Clostridia bacterium]|nr:hypothetical protein [Clostridia bacterium]